MESDTFRWWCQRMAYPFTLHRKMWEYCYIAQALYERGMLAPGRRGLGFAVGHEPLVYLFASFGCEIVATDLHTEEARKRGWVDTGQHADRVDDLNPYGVCDPDEFRRLVSFRFVDMNDVPDDLTGFDFVWSSCAFEHLGSIGRGKRFIERMTHCVRPGGVAVHTTEYNLTSNWRTISRGRDVLYRRRDLEGMARSLRKAGHAIDLDFREGTDFYDKEALPPYPYRVPHLRLKLGRYDTTSIGLIIDIGKNPPTPSWWERWLKTVCSATARGRKP